LRRKTLRPENALKKEIDYNDSATSRYSISEKYGIFN
jgi:hypothetical protein